MSLAVPSAAPMYSLTGCGFPMLTDVGLGSGGGRHVQQHQHDEDVNGAHRYQKANPECVAAASAIAQADSVAYVILASTKPRSGWC